MYYCNLIVLNEKVFNFFPRLSVSLAWSMTSSRFANLRQNQPLEEVSSVRLCVCDPVATDALVLIE